MPNFIYKCIKDFLNPINDAKNVSAYQTLNVFYTRWTKCTLGPVIVSVVPGRHVVGQAVHSLKSVTMQSLLQGNKQGRNVSGRAESGHL